MFRLLDQVQQWMAEAELRFDRLDQPSCLRLPFETSGQTWTCIIRVSEAPRYVAAYGAYPFSALVRQRAGVAALMTRVNFGLIIGKLELDLDDGEMHFMAAVELSGVEAQRQQLLNLVEHVVDSTTYYFDALQMVAHGAAGPDAALATLNCDEPAADAEPQ